MTASSEPGWEQVDFHGIPIRRQTPCIEGDAYSELFASFRRQSSGAHQIAIELFATAEPVTLASRANLSPALCSGRVQGYLAEDGYVLHDGASLMHVDRRALRIRGQISRSDASSSVTHGMQHLALSLALRELSVFEVHAATLCTQEVALMLLGDSGAGKTSTALALLEAGAHYLGDDRTLLRLRGAEPELLSYPREFHVPKAALELHPALASLVESPQGIFEKCNLSANIAFPGRHLPSWCGRVLLLPTHIEPAPRTELRACTKADSFGRLLAASAIVAVEGVTGQPAHLAALERLANCADTHELVLGHDLLQQPRQVGERILRWAREIRR